MNDMSATIVAKSDQINAADLIGTTRTITIKEVRIKDGDDQPVTILFEGDKKAYRPCKGVRRLMVRVWSKDANKYIGQSMTLFEDPSVIWAGKPAGGIRVSHMTGLDEPIVEMMRINRTTLKPYEILPLVMNAPRRTNAPQTAEEWAAAHMDAIGACETLDALDTLCNAPKSRGGMAKLSGSHPDTHRALLNAADARRAELAPEPRPDDQFGDGDGFAEGDG